MRKKCLHIFTILTVAMTMLFGSVLTVSAEEINSSYIEDFISKVAVEESMDSNITVYTKYPLGEKSFEFGTYCIMPMSYNSSSEHYYKYTNGIYKFAVTDSTGDLFVTYFTQSIPVVVETCVTSSFSDENFIQPDLSYANSTKYKTWNSLGKFENGVQWFYMSVLISGEDKVSNVPEISVPGTYQEFINQIKVKSAEYTVENIPVTDFDGNFYLKNIGYTVRAENSSEYPDETFIKFTWDIDNLEMGDTIEIRTRNHYTKFGGDQVIGFHDFITSLDGVSAYDGSYEFSQTESVKAWFATVEPKPFAFKDYDTDIYFLRPVRGSVGGGWVRVEMGRKTPTSSPFIKDIEYGELTEDGEWVKDEDATASEGGNHGLDQGGNVISSEYASNILELENIGDLFKYLISNLQTLIGYFGQLPQLIQTVIGWLPTPIIVLICGFIGLIIILRIFGR